MVVSIMSWYQPRAKMCVYVEGLLMRSGTFNNSVLTNVSILAGRRIESPALP